MTATASVAVRSRVTRWPPIVALVLALQAAAAQDQPANSAEAEKSPPVATTASPSTAQAHPGDPPDGIWPSRKLMQLVLIRMADRVADRYDLDEKQKEQLRDMTIDRWTRFAEEHRRELQPLLNEFLEMRMDLDPPSKERVKNWADRVMPVFEEYRGEFKEATEEFRETLGPMQRTKLEVDALQYRIGMELVESKLRNWQKGEFDPNDLWNGPPGHSSRKRDEREPDDQDADHVDRPEPTLADAGPPVEPRGPDDQIAVELGLWDKYVAKFIRVYRLDEAQRDAVLSCLAELKQRALAHRDTHWNEIVALEDRIADNAGKEPQLAEIKKQLVDLYGPIDMMFQELKERLENIPTEPQRAAAERHEDFGRQGAQENNATAAQPATSSTPPD